MEKNRYSDAELSEFKALITEKINIAKDRFHTINDLLVYAPEIFLENLENTLKNYIIAQVIKYYY